MDLLDFEALDLYFEQEDSEEVNALLKQASDDYNADAERPLLRAYFLAPESLNVLVALNRFYYYQHRLQDSLIATEKALCILKNKLSFPNNWQMLELTQIKNTPPELLTQVRAYLFTLKAIGFLNMRLQRLETSRAIFKKIIEVDEHDRIGAKALLALLENEKDF